jgi:hypothetical protein
VRTSAAKLALQWMRGLHWRTDDGDVIYSNALASLRKVAKDLHGRNASEDRGDFAFRGVCER